MLRHTARKMGTLSYEHANPGLLRGRLVERATSVLVATVIFRRHQLHNVSLLQLYLILPRLAPTMSHAPLDTVIPVPVAVESLIILSLEQLVFTMMTVTF